MKRFVTYKFAAIFALLQMLPSQWKQTEDPYGASIGRIIFNDDSIYVGTFSGIFSSSQTNIQWNKLTNNNNATHNISGLYTTQGAIFAGLGGTLVISKNYGKSWDTVHFPVSAGITKIFSTPKFIIIGISGVGNYYSSDTGRTWTKYTSGFATSSEYAWGYQKLRDTLYLSTSNGFYKSIDSGSTWKRINKLDNIRSILYVGDTLYWTSSAGVFRSFNYGYTFHPVNTNLTPMAINWSNSLIHHKGKLYFSTTYIVDKIFRSSTDSIAWEDITSDSGKITIDFLSHNGILYKGTLTGMYRSMDDGASWQDINTGMKGLGITAVYKHNDTLFAGTNGGVFRSRSIRHGWERVNNGITNLYYQRYTFASNPSTLYVGVTDFSYYSGGGVFSTTNSGEKWMSKGLANLYIMSLVFSNDTLYAGTSSGVYVSYDQGMTWYVKNTGLTLTYVKALTKVGNTLYVGPEPTQDYPTNIYRSTNGGNTWQPAITGLPYSQGIQSFAYNSKYIFAAALDRVYRTRHDTLRWEGWQSFEYCKQLYADDSLLLLTTLYGLYRSRDDGKTWINITGNLQGTSFASMTVYKDTVVVGTQSQSLYYQALKDLAVSVGKIDRIPETFTLYQNYPNPFNPSTTISFDVPKESPVQLHIYNILGQEIEVLLNREVSAGRYSVRWDASKYSSGMYFYRLRSGSSVQSRKLILLR